MDCGGVRISCLWKTAPTPLSGPPQGHDQGYTVWSCGEAVSYGRGTPVGARASGSRVEKGVGLRVQGSGSGVQGSLRCPGERFLRGKVYDLGSRVQGLGLRVWGLGFMV